MSEENWKLQVSYKTITGDMINIRANSADELSVLLEGIGDYSPQIASVHGLIKGAYNVLPLATSTSTPDSTQSVGSGIIQAPPASATTVGAPAPTCIHGPRKYLSGVSKKNGQPYKFWACPMPQGQEQCKPVNA